MSHDDDMSRYTKPFVEHLVDLRVTILWCVSLLLLGTVVSIPFAPKVLGLLGEPLLKAGKDPAVFLQNFNVTGGVGSTMRIVIWCGVLLALPGIITAICWFIFPGLTSKERRAATIAAAFAALLFVAGICMAYYVTLPIGLSWMFKINDWMNITVPFFELGDYMSFTLKVMIGFGLACELPVIVLALGLMGVLSSAQMRSKRPHVIVGLLIIAMLLTPPDIVTQILMAAPMALLYEGCIWITWAKERGARRALDS